MKLKKERKPQLVTLILYIFYPRGKIRMKSNSQLIFSGHPLRLVPIASQVLAKYKSQLNKWFHYDEHSIKLFTLIFIAKCILTIFSLDLTLGFRMLADLMTN